MNDQMQDLARRAVACKHWRWMPGMLVMSDPERVPRVIGSPVWPSELRARVTSEVLGRWHGVWQYCVSYPDAEHDSMSSDDLPGALPDLTDPATLGCLVALLRKAWDSPMLNTVQERGIGWIVADSLCCSMLANGRYYRGDTEAEALVAALEAAP